MKTTRLFLISTAFALGSAALAPAAMAASPAVEFATVADSANYICRQDTSIYTLQVKTDYTLPVSAVKPSDRVKLNNMLITAAGVDFNMSGMPSADAVASYQPEPMNWKVLTLKDTPDVNEFFDRNPESRTYACYTVEGTVKPESVSDSYLSMKATRYAYVGGAHGMYAVAYVNYSLAEQRFVELADFVKADKYDALGKVIYEKARKKYELLTDDVKPTENISVAADGITFVYQPYEIAPWSNGAPEIFLTWDEISKL